MPKNGTTVALSALYVSRSSAAERSLLDNDDVVSYLQDLDSAGDFETERSIHTSTPQFRAEVAALGEGMLDDDAPHQLAQVGPPPSEPYRFAPAPAENESANQTRTSPLGAVFVPLTGFGTALFLLGMSLLGASSAAIVFHDRVFRILGW